VKGVYCIRRGDTGTAHDPGIQPADVEELLEHGADVVVLSKGVLERLKICPETLEMLKNRDVAAHALRTEEAVRRYFDDITSYSGSTRWEVSFIRPADIGFCCGAASSGRS